MSDVDTGVWVYKSGKRCTLSLDGILINQDVLQHVTTMDVVLLENESLHLTARFDTGDEWRREFNQSDLDKFVNLVRQQNPKVSMANEIDSMDAQTIERLLWVRWLLTTGRITDTLELA